MATSKRSKIIYIPLVLVPLAVVAAVVYAVWFQPKAATPAADPYRPKAETGQATQPSTTVTASPTPIPTSTVPQTSKNGEIVIASPTQGGTVKSGTMVSGTATTSNNRLYYRLKGGKSGQLTLGSIEFAGNASSPVAYSFELAFTNQVAAGGDQGVLEVFTLGSDGSEQTIANVTVNIQP